MPNPKLSKREVAIAISQYVGGKNKIARKQVRTIINICRRPASATPLPQRFLRDAPFICSSRARLERPLGDGSTIEIVASKAGAPNDRDMLLVVSVFQEAFKGLSKDDLKQVAAGGALAEVRIPTSELRWWHQGRINNLNQASARLSAYTVLYTYPSGEVDSHRYFAEFKIKDSVLIALIDRDMAARTLTSSWTIDIEPFKRLRNSIARGLYLLLAPDHRKMYDILDLAIKLGLPIDTAEDKRDTIGDIIEAFKALAALEIFTLLPAPDKKNIRKFVHTEWPEMRKLAQTIQQNQEEADCAA